MSPFIELMGTLLVCLFMVFRLKDVHLWWAYVVRFSYAVCAVALMAVAAGKGAVASFDEGFFLTLVLYAVALLVARRRQTAMTQLLSAVIALGVFSMSVVMTMIVCGATAPPVVVV